MAAAGIESAIKILDGDAKTAAAAAEQLNCEVGAIANGLVFDCDGEPVLVTASGGEGEHRHPGRGAPRIR